MTKEAKNHLTDDGFSSIQVPGLSNEETVIGRHTGSGVELVEGANNSRVRFLCPSCKKKIHCRVKIDKKTKEATIIKTCKDAACECRCRTHYECKICGHLHPYDQLECDRDEAARVKYSAASNAEIAEIMDQFRKLKQETKVEVKS